MNKLMIIGLGLGVSLAAISLGACTDSDRAIRAAKSMGFTDVKPGGYGWFRCGDDTFSTSFTAKDAHGEPVSGVVCSGWLKGATVRTD